MNNKVDRDYGIDILRILSMMGIIILHINGAGGVLNTCRDLQENTSHWIAFWVEIMAYTSVDVFGLLSGYLGLFKKRNTSYRVIELICIVIFYCLGITLVFLLAFPETVVGIKGLLISLFPQIDGRYWYITCFIPIGLLQPYINKMILALSEKEHRRLSIIIVVLFGFLQSAVIKDLFVFKAGYSFVWLLCLYIIGSYIKRVDLFKTSNRIRLKSFVILLTGSLVLLFGNVLIDVIVHKNLSYFVNYISPIILLMSVCIVFIFRNYSIKSGRRIISILSLVTFDVYLFHCHILIYDNILTDRFCWIAKEKFLIPIIIVVCALGVFMASSVVGILRYYIFLVTKTDVLIKTISFKLDKLLYENSEKSI